MADKWEISGWGSARAQIQEAVHFLCEGKIGPARRLTVTSYAGVRVHGETRWPE